MSGLPYAESYRGLFVYQKARQLAFDVCSISKTFPKEERYSLTDQIRRSSRSIGAQIAEAWAKRDYEKHFVSKLTDADAEQLETQHWVDTASDCGYLPEEQLHDLISKCSEIGRLISSMIAKSDLFCNPQNRRISELRTDYFVKQIAVDTEP